MAAITNVQQPTAQKLDVAIWRLSVTYTATFSAFEVANYHFQDDMQLWEADPAKGQQLTDWRNDTYFNPASESVVRTKTIVVREAALATEEGPQEIYIKIRIYNFNLNEFIERDSPILRIGV
jgi:hypothetical protein